MCIRMVTFPWESGRSRNRTKDMVGSLGQGMVGTGGLLNWSTQKRASLHWSLSMVLLYKLYSVQTVHNMVWQLICSECTQGDGPALKLISAFHYVCWKGNHKIHDQATFAKGFTMKCHQVCKWKSVCSTEKYDIDYSSRSIYIYIFCRPRFSQMLPYKQHCH